MVPLVLDSPHSGREFPGDFDAVVSEAELREGEDCYVDELWAAAGTPDGVFPIAPAELLRVSGGAAAAFGAS